MKTTMDKAGRIVVPAALRERRGPVPGEVDTSAAVPLCVGSAADHAAVIEDTQRAVLGLVGHAAIETFSAMDTYARLDVMVDFV